MSTETSRLVSPRAVRIALAITVFGVLMALRSEVGPAWAKVLVAAVAGGVLGITLVSVRKRN